MDLDQRSRTSESINGIGANRPRLWREPGPEEDVHAPFTAILAAPHPPRIGSRPVQTLVSGQRPNRQGHQE